MQIRLVLVISSDNTKVSNNKTVSSRQMRKEKKDIDIVESYLLARIMGASRPGLLAFLSSHSNVVRGMDT